VLFVLVRFDRLEQQVKKLTARGYATNRREIPPLRVAAPSQERKSRKNRPAPVGMTLFPFLIGNN
jgi:hypothetical protein